MWSEIYDENNMIYKNKVNNTLTNTILKQKEKKEQENIYYDINSDEIQEKISNILVLDFMDLNDLELLKHSNFIGNYLYKYITHYHYLHERTRLQNELDIEVIDIDHLTKIIKWLQNMAEYFTKKLKLQVIHIKRTEFQNHFIPRLRYDFCKFGGDCQFNYGNRRKQKCKEDHYVYNKLFTDLTVILAYINKFNDEVIKHSDILKNFKTIQYVIKHMYDEFNKIALYIKENEYAKFHIVK